MQFLNPIWLWGLTGLLIPISIHLLSRKEGKVIKIGSIRHLDETATTRFRSLRLQEYTLLALRCLLITLLVIFFSDPIIVNLDKKEKWLLVENGLEKYPDFKLLIDSLKENGFQLRTLTKGFPILTAVSVQHSDMNYYNLLASLKKTPIQQAIVIAHNRFDNFRGRRIALPTNVQWITKNPVDHTFNLYSYPMVGDSVLIRGGNSTANKTTFQFRHSALGKPDTSDTIKIETPSTLSISIFHDATFAYDAKIIEAALHAIDKFTPGNFSIQKHLSENHHPDSTANWRILLGENFSTQENENTIYFNRSSHGNTKLFVQRPEVKASWMLTKRLNEEVAIQENLTVQLADILFSDSKHEVILKRNDRRAMPEQLLWAKMADGQAEPLASTDSTKTRKIILAMFLMMLLAERLISYKQNQ